MWNCFILLLSNEMIFIKMKWQLIIDKSHSYNIFDFRIVLMLIKKKCWCCFHTDMCDYLAGLVEYISFIYNKNNRSPNLDPWRTLEFKVLLLQRDCPMKLKKLCYWGKNKTISLFSLKNWYTLFFLIQFYDFRC